LNAFSKSLTVATLLLLGVSGVLAFFWPSLHLVYGWAGFLLMALNAWAAIAILRLRDRVEPTKLILTSMLTRMFAVVAIMLAVIFATSQADRLYSFVFCAMAGFVVFQAIEIRHILRNPELVAQ
jgi:hypothetical protein